MGSIGCLSVSMVSLLYPIYTYLVTKNNTHLLVHSSAGQKYSITGVKTRYQHSLAPSRSSVEKFILDLFQIWVAAGIA
jgi:hypothetical protein